MRPTRRRRIGAENCYEETSKDSLAKEALRRRPGFSSTTKEAAELIEKLWLATKPKWDDLRSKNVYPSPIWTTTPGDTA